VQNQNPGNEQLWIPRASGTKFHVSQICDRHAKIAILKNIQIIKEKRKKLFAMEVSTKTFCG